MDKMQCGWKALLNMVMVRRKTSLFPNHIRSWIAGLIKIMYLSHWNIIIISLETVTVTEAGIKERCIRKIQARDESMFFRSFKLYATSHRSRRSYIV